MSSHDDTSAFFTVSQKAIIGDGKGRILLLEKAGQNTHWDLPGGKLDNGEDMEEGLAREIREETGLKVRIGDVIYVGQRSFPEEGKTDRVMLFYLCKPRGSVKSITLSEEHKRWKFLERKETKGLEMNDVMRAALDVAFDII